MASLLTVLINGGAPEWLQVLVVLCTWNATKFALMGRSASCCSSEPERENDASGARSAARSRNGLTPLLVAALRRCRCSFSSRSDREGAFACLP